MSTGTPDCPRCAADGAFREWLQAHRLDAVREDHIAHAHTAAYDVLKAQTSLRPAEALRVADAVLEAARPHLRTDVWVHWVEYILERAAAAPGGTGRDQHAQG